MRNPFEWLTFWIFLYFAAQNIHIPVAWNWVSIEKFGIRFLLSKVFETILILNVSWLIIRLVKVGIFVAQEKWKGVDQKSKQQFTEVDMEFEKHYIASTIIQILPESRKPAEVKQMKTKQSQLLSSDEVIELIKKLSDLHSSGILTDEEFSSKKAELLSKI